MQCPCGRGPCALQRAADGRWQYFCSARLKCSYSSWCNETDLSPQPAIGSPLKPENPHVWNSPSNQRLNATTPVSVTWKGARSHNQHPICSCGAGKCSILMRKGRRYYVCAIKQGQGACGHFEPVDGPEEPPETGHYSPGEEKHLRYNPVEKETNEPGLDQVAENNETRLVNSDLPMDEQWPFDFNDKGQLIANTQVVPESPKRKHQPHAIVETSPMKRPTPPNGIGSPVTPGSRKCFRCGEEGHWYKDCSGSPISPCYKCGKVGHWAKNCTG